MPNVTILVHLLLYCLKICDLSVLTIDVLL
jgi:hypothetical protein